MFTIEFFVVIDSRFILVELNSVQTLLLGYITLEDFEINFINICGILSHSSEPQIFKTAIFLLRLS